MKSIIKYSLLVIIGLMANLVSAQEHKVELEKGNNEQFFMRYNNALSHYDSSISINPSYFFAIFNSGNSWYRISQSATDTAKIAFANEAADRFESAIYTTDNKEQQSYGHYNQGNCFLSINESKQSIESYKEALRAYPKNKHARYNLSYALIMLKSQEEKMEDIQEQIDSLQKEIDENKEEQKKNESSSKSEQEKQQKKNELEQKKEELEKKKQELEKQKQQGEKESGKEEKEQGEKQESDKGDKSEQNGEGDKKDGEQQSGEPGKEGEKGEQVQQEAFTLREAKQNLDALKNEEKKVQLKVLKKRGREINRTAGEGTREEKDW